MTLRRTRRLDIYIVIKELRKEHSEYSLCQLCMIGHVNRGAYYKWMNNPDSQNDALNKRIADKIMEIHGEHPDMGYRRIRDTLAHDHDINVSDKRVLRICRKKRVQSIIRHRYNCCTKPAADPVYIAENVLNREFHADHLNEKWVTDVSEFKYGAGNNDAKGKVYLSAILDLCDKRPVSYVCGDRNDNTLVFDTFDKALEANSGAKPLFHSDYAEEKTMPKFMISPLH